MSEDDDDDNRSDGGGDPKGPRPSRGSPFSGCSLLILPVLGGFVALVLYGLLG